MQNRLPDFRYSKRCLLDGMVLITAFIRYANACTATKSTWVFEKVESNSILVINFKLIGKAHIFKSPYCFCLKCPAHKKPKRCFHASAFKNIYGHYNFVNFSTSVPAAVCSNTKYWPALNAVASICSCCVIPLYCFW